MTQPLPFPVPHTTTNTTRRRGKKGRSPSESVSPLVGEGRRSRSSICVSQSPCRVPLARPAFPSAPVSLIALGREPFLSPSSVPASETKAPPVDAKPCSRSEKNRPQNATKPPSRSWPPLIACTCPSAPSLQKKHAEADSRVFVNRAWTPGSPRAGLLLMMVVPAKAISNRSCKLASIVAAFTVSHGTRCPVEAFWRPQHSHRECCPR